MKCVRVSEHLKSIEARFEEVRPTNFWSQSLWWYCDTSSGWGIEVVMRSGKNCKDMLLEMMYNVEWQLLKIHLLHYTLFNSSWIDTTFLYLNVLIDSYAGLSCWRDREWRIRDGRYSPSRSRSVFRSVAPVMREIIGRIRSLQGVLDPFPGLLHMKRGIAGPQALERMIEVPVKRGIMKSAGTFHSEWSLVG